MSEPTLAQIAENLRLLSSELKGYDDVPQWLHVEKAALDIERERRRILSHCNLLARRLVRAEELGPG